MKGRRSAGFTLLELLVVIVIIGMLVLFGLALFLPFPGNKKEGQK